MKPTAALLPVALLAGILLLVDARVRILFVVFGGLLTLQSSSGFGSLKLLYLAGIMASFGAALFSFSRSSDTSMRWFVWPILRASVAISALILVSYLVAKDHAVVRVDWLRDVAPYLLFAMAPFFALDAQRAFSRRALVRLLVIGGLVATASFSTHWLEQRNIANLPFSQFALSSFFFPAALFAYATAAGLHERQHRTRWLALAALVFRAPRGYRNAFDSDPRRSSSSRRNRCSSQSRRSLCSARLAGPSGDPRDRGAGDFGSSGDACVYGDHQQARCDLEEQWHLVRCELPRPSGADARRQ